MAAPSPLPRPVLILLSVGCAGGAGWGLFSGAEFKAVAVFLLASLLFAGVDVGTTLRALQGGGGEPPPAGPEPAPDNGGGAP